MRLCLSHMITVIIPTLNASSSLSATFASIIPAAVDGFISRVIVVDGGSSDQTLDIAGEAGADIIYCEKGRGRQLSKGGNAATTDWLLFLHADTVLAKGWEKEVAIFIGQANHEPAHKKAAAFKFAIDEPGVLTRFMEIAVALRCAIFALPYGDQGLLICAKLYHEIGGFQPMPLMEDVDIIRKIGCKNLTLFKTPALTSYARYRKDGHFKRIWRNLTCLALYFCGVSSHKIAQRYE